MVRGRTKPRYVYNEGGRIFEVRIVAAVMVRRPNPNPKRFRLGGFVVEPRHAAHYCRCFSLSFPLLTVVIFIASGGIAGGGQTEPRYFYSEGMEERPTRRGGGWTCCTSLFK